MRVCAACLAAIVLAGCGASSEADRVRATVRDYARAVAHRDARTLCARILSPDLAAATARAAGRPCAAALQDALTGSPPRARSASAVRVEGDTATARLGAETLSLVRTRAGWRLASLGNDGGVPTRR